MHLHRHEYIAAGCLGISCNEANIANQFWDTAELKLWRSLRQQQGLNQLAESQSVHGGEDYLSASVQEHLSQLEPFHQAFLLFRSQWIDLEFCVNADGSYGTLRVYLLPDDTYRGLIDKTSLGLRKARSRLLHSLDYSRDVWEGLAIPSKDNISPLRGASLAGDENESLLQVFNKIPSPSPDPDLVNDVFSRDAMIDMSGSTISGLSTELYPYQRRSIAAMMQKEVEPGSILDPRLVAIDGHDGTTWYVDPVVGTTLKEPRFYDGVSGGILAEEMGSGKTIICLALIMATRNLPTRPPDLYSGTDRPRRRKLASLADMAASCATRNAIPWKSYFETWRRQAGYKFDRCEATLERNPGYYMRPAPKLRRTGRNFSQELQPTKIYLSNATVVVVPNNLLSQWKQEIAKHTHGLNVRVLVKHEELPSLSELLDPDIILFSQSRFEKMVKEYGGVGSTALSIVHFKRCIVDEGHKLGNSKIGRKSCLLIGLDGMNFSSKWIVTGTPSHGLFGVDNRTLNGNSVTDPTSQESLQRQTLETSAGMEKKDLERIGSITSLYLKARPWANASTENEDTLAHWGTYLLLPRHNKNAHGRWDCLKATLNSLIIRHRLSDIGDMLPPVDKRVIVLDGTYQDRLSLNLFAMMITFNAVQTQRTDLDYFFHPRQRRSLLEIVTNLKQSSFFGGYFFTSEEIAKSVEIAENFLKEKKVPISEEESIHLQKAIHLGKIAIEDKLRNHINQHHEMPIWVHGPLGDASYAWSLDGEGGDTICTSASMILSLQRLLARAAHEPESLNSLLNGGLIQEGLLERSKLSTPRGSDQVSGAKKNKEATLAKPPKLSDDSRRRKSRSHAASVNPTEAFPVESLPPALQQTNVISTVSSKLSYLIDGVVRHQEDEKIIIFYEHENFAWYFANVLDMLQIQHLIYAKSLTMERKAQYVHTFHGNPVFRVLLMDLSQAAFGLDMHGASRIYFVNPVLNPQVEAQAIGRVRRISQQKPVFVETLVLKDSIDEVILERKEHMTQAEHRQVKSILDVRPIYDWIKNATILDMPNLGLQATSDKAALTAPQPVFGRGFGSNTHPDEGIILGDSPIKARAENLDFARYHLPITPVKRTFDAGPGHGKGKGEGEGGKGLEEHELVVHPVRRVRFADSAG